MFIPNLKASFRNSSDLFQVQIERQSIVSNMQLPTFHTTMLFHLMCHFQDLRFKKVPLNYFD